MEQRYTRARELCQQLGETPQLFPVLWGLWAFYLVRGELQHGAGAGGAVPAARPADEQDSALLLEAHLALGVSLVVRWESLSAARRASGAGRWRSTIRSSTTRLAFALWRMTRGWCVSVYDGLGSVVSGLSGPGPERSHEALHSGPGAGSSLIAWRMHLICAAWLHQLPRGGARCPRAGGGADGARKRARFPFWLAWGTILRGWALVEQGQ